MRRGPTAKSARSSRAYLRQGATACCRSARAPRKHKSHTADRGRVSTAAAARRRRAAQQRAASTVAKATWTGTHVVFRLRVCAAIQQQNHNGPLVPAVLCGMVQRRHAVLRALHAAQPQQRDSRRVSAFQRRAQRSGRQGRAAQPKPRYARSRRAPPPRTAAYCEHVAVRGFGASWATHPVSRLQVCAAVQQQSHHGRVAAHGGHLKRRPAKLRAPRAARARRQPARTRFQLHNATAAGAGSAQSPCTLCLRLRPAPRAPPPRRRSSPILASLYFPPWLRVRRCARGSDAAQRWLGASGSSSGACAGAALHGGAPNGARVGYM